MQEWLDNNGILIYSKQYDSKSYLSYLNKLGDQYYNTYYHSINKTSY